MAQKPQTPLSLREPPLAWDCSAWVRTYGLLLKERLECYKSLKYDIESECIPKPTQGDDKFDSEFPRGHIAIKSSNVEVVDEAGESVSFQETYLHYWVEVSVRAKKYYQRTCKKIFINGNDIAGYDKSKVECYNCHKLGHFVRECRAPRSKEGFDWSDMAEEQVQTNMALMAFSDSEITNKSKKGFGYSAVPPPHPLIYNRPNKLDLSYSGLDEFKEPEFKGYGLENNKKESNVICENQSENSKENSDKSLVKEQVSQIKSSFVEGCGSNTSKSVSEVEPKEVRKNNDALIIEDWGASHNIMIKDLLTFNGGYVAFGGGAYGGKISSKGTLKTDNLDFEDILKGPLSCTTLLSDVSLMHKKYCLVVTDDYSRFTWVFFLTTKDETSEILKRFIKEIENLVDKKVKIIRSDNGTEFKNKVMDDFCREKGIKREYSIARTPQQNGVLERRNRTLIEAARTMLADSKLPTTFWAEAVSTACYVQNRVLVVKPHNKTPYELLEFDGKSDEGFFVGYSLSSKAFRVYNTRTKRVEENLHIGFLENEPMIEGTGPKWLFDIDSLTQSMNYVPVTTGTVSNDSADMLKKQVEDGLNNENAEQERFADDSSSKDVNVVGQQVNTASLDVNTVKSTVQTRRMSKPTSEQGFLSDVYELKTHDTINTCLYACFLSQIKPTSIAKALSDSSWVEAMQEELLQFKLQQVWILVDLPNGKKAIGTKRVFRNKKDERGIMIRNKASEARLVAQGHRQEEGIDYEEVFALVARIEAIRLFLAYASFMGFLIKFTRWSRHFMVCIKHKEHDDIIFGSTNKELCTGFEKLMKDKFQMSSMGELTFFLGLQVQQKEDGIFISQDKYVVEILKKFNYSNVKSASTPVYLEKPLVKDGDADDVDVHLYRSMIGSLMYLTASRLDILFADSPFELVSYTDSDYTGATLDRKSTTGGLNYYCQTNVNAVKRTWAPKLQLFSNSYQLRHCLRGGISQEVGTPRYLSLVVPLTKVGDEAVHKELGDRMERAATTASSLEAEQDSGSGPRCQDTILGDVNAQTRFEITSIQSIDPPLSRGYTLGSGEDNIKLIGIDGIFPKFAKTHNVVAFLEKPKESDEFAEIIDFLKASSVSYALTIQALVDKKRVIVTESSIRRDLHLNDAEGTDSLLTATIFEELARMGAKSTAWNEFSSSMASLIICLATNQKFNLSKYMFDAMVKHLDVGVKFLLYPHFLQVFINQQLGNMSIHKKFFVNPFHTKKVFTNMKRAGKDFSERITPLFDTMMVQPVEEMGEDSGNPTDSTPIPIIDQPSSSSQPKKDKLSKKVQRQEAEVPQDEVEHDESVPTPSSDPQPSGDDSMKLTDFDFEEDPEERRVFCQIREFGCSRRLHPKQGVGSIEDIDADIDVSLVDETQERQDDDLIFNTGMDDVEMLVEAKVDRKDEPSTKKLDDSTASETIKAAKPKFVTTAATTATTTRPKDKGVVVQEPCEFRVPQEIIPLSSKDKGKEEQKLQGTMKKKQHALMSMGNTQAMMEADRLLAERLQSKEREELTDEEKAKLFMELMEKRRKHFAALRAQEKRNRPPTKA
ncbi:retrovirus-related pol polyprotein from transposon TNT 1-94 [Tanacetum coccineum]